MVLLHASISAKDPERVAAFLATLLGGTALPFPPFPDSWIAFAGQDARESLTRAETFALYAPEHAG